MTLTVSPPGSFLAAANTAFEEEARREMREVVSTVREAIEGLPVLGLILTGSFARGEGTIVAEPAGGSRWLSDLESLVVFKTHRRRTGEEIHRRLQRLTGDRNGAPDSRARNVKLELSVIPAQRLRRMRPSLFVFELATHGKLLFGDPARIPPFGASLRRGIPKRDAFRLLNNRIVEQVDARLCLDDATLDKRVSVAYAICKFWLDLATSMSIFLGLYRASYNERCAIFGDQTDGTKLPLPAALLAHLSDHLREATEIKFGRKPVRVDCFAQSFAEAAASAAGAWDWESRQLLDDPRDDGDWRSVLARLKRLETARQRARDWARLLIRPDRRGYLKPSIIRGALRFGSFANVIYGSGCLLEFFWDEIAAQTEKGVRIARAIAELLEVRHDPLQPQSLAASTVKAWDRHLRFAPL